MGTSSSADAPTGLEGVVRVLEPAPLPMLVCAPQGVVLWANRTARRVARDVVGQDLVGIAGGRAARVRHTLELARASSYPLILGLDIAGRSALWHVWRVASGPAEAPPVLVLQEDARGRMLSRFVSLKQEAETVGADRDRAAAAARRLREQAARLQAQMRVDRLTGVMNAGGMEEFTRRVLADPEARGVFVFADLDGFKAVNDSFGHDAGDAVLKEIARRFAAATRSGDCVARLGGDEFAFWFEGMNEAEVDDIVARLEEAAQRPVDWSDPSGGGTVRLRVAASFGRAVAPDDGRTFAGLRAAADARMYTHKRRKRASVVP